MRIYVLLFVGLFTTLPGHVASAEEVLLSLPGKFTVKCEEAHRVSTTGVRDGNREKVVEITKKKPLVFEFQGEAFSAKHSSVETTEPAPGLKHRTETTTTITGKLNRGVLTGKYTQYYTFYDCSDSSRPDGFLCWKCSTYGKVAGQADANGRLHVAISNWSYKAEQRDYGSHGNQGGRGYRIVELGPWKDVTEEMKQNDPNAKTAIECDLQLPVGEVISSQGD